MRSPLRLSPARRTLVLSFAVLEEFHLAQTLSSLSSGLVRSAEILAFFRQHLVAASRFSNHPSPPYSLHWMTKTQELDTNCHRESQQVPKAGIMGCAMP